MFEEKVPYLILSYKLKEDNAEYDWSTLDKWAESEIVHFEYEVSKENYEGADLIIDVLNGKILKSNLKNVENHNVIEHYCKLYEKNIITHVRQYFKRFPEAWEGLLKVVNKTIGEIDKN